MLVFVIQRWVNSTAGDVVSLPVSVGNNFELHMPLCNSNLAAASYLQNLGTQTLGPEVCALKHV